MKNYFYIVCIGLYLGACTSNTIIKKPDNLIPKDQMVDLLTDMLLASGARNVKNLKLEREINYFPLVFEKYNIDSLQFKESNYYYTSRIDDYDEILGKIEKRLNSLKNQYDEDQKLSDSLRRKEKDSLKYFREQLQKEEYVK